MRIFSPTTISITTTPILLLFTTTSRSFATMTSNNIKPWNVLTFNIAAVNNNPFEYWLTAPDQRYNELMDGVEVYMNAPHIHERSVGEIFEWYENIEKLLRNNGLATEEQLVLLKERWNSDLAPRKIVSGFLKDPIFGTKRLISMPDRVTNTINIQNGDVLYRPTPISCYQGRFKNISDWWKQWLQFMFAPNPLLPGKKAVAHLLKPISRSKYPEVTESDEKISIPLQILCQGIFDAVLVHMLNKISLAKFNDETVWQDLRAQMCQALNLQKNNRLMDIITAKYAPLTDVMCLQEVAHSFAERTSKELGKEFTVFVPTSASAASREQNSVIVLRTKLFHSVSDVTEQVIGILKNSSTAQQQHDVTTKKKSSTSTTTSTVPVEDGDLLVVRATSSENNNVVLIASFHGDTDGLATIPVLGAIHEFAQQNHIEYLLFGLDANAYEKPKPGKQLNVLDFSQKFRELGMTSCWGLSPNPSFYTTYNARTYLQPQLNKASGRTEMKQKGDVNPKDFILTYDSTAEFNNAIKDNTGELKYIEDMVFPTLSFPSDHGIVSSEVILKIPKTTATTGGATKGGMKSDL
jgi:hypothetical protein